jgi:hypothetical protein
MLGSMLAPGGYSRSTRRQSGAAMHGVHTMKLGRWVPLNSTHDSGLEALF